MKEGRTASLVAPSAKSTAAPRRVRGARARLVMAALTLALFAGCTSWRDYIANGFKVGPNYCRPAAPVAQQWLDAGDPALDTRRTEDSAWWRTFNDPVLNTLVDCAYRQNLTLRVAGLRILEARAQRGIAVGNLFPQSQQAFGDYNRTATSSRGFSGFIPDRFFSEWTLGANLAWELDFWGRFRRAIEAADANLDGAVENYDDVLVLLLADVAQTYTEVRISEERLSYAHRNVEIQGGSLRLAEERLRNGATTRLDVTQAVSNLAQTEAAIPLLEAARRQSINQLCILLGIPPQSLDELLVPHRPIPAAPPQVAIGIPAELLRRRPDVRRAEREVAEQSAMIGVAVADLYPQFTINGTIFLNAQSFEDLFNADAMGGSIGPAFRWNILNYGRLTNNIRVQEARFQQLAVQYQNVVLQANREAEDAIIGFLKSQQSVRSLVKSASAAGESVEIVSAQYNEGTVDFDRVFNVQQFLTQQQDQLVRAQGEVAQFLIQLYRSLGGGWQIRLGSPIEPGPMATGEPAEPVSAPAPEPAQPMQPPLANEPDPR